MDSLKSLLLQARETWEHSTRSQQAMLVAGGLLIVAVVAGVGFWASRPVYVPVASNLSPSQAMEVVSQLESAGVSHRVSFSARQVLVPKSEWSQAMMAVGETLETAPGAPDELVDGPFVDPNLQHYQMMRQQEALLARTIAQIESIESATVHISRPEPSPFVRDRRSVTASVVLKLGRGQVFSREQASAITGLVNHSVEGLTPENITLLDTAGRMLSADGGFDADMDGQLDYRRRLEADLASKAEVLLSQLLGPGRSIVRLTTEIDFKESVTDEMLYDPDGGARSSETIITSTTSGGVSSSIGGSGSIGAAGATGAAGTVANTDTSVALPPSNNVPLKHEENITAYDNSLTHYETTEHPGTIKRLTVAAIVDLPTQDDGAGEQSAITPEQVTLLIKQAVGFDEQRNDEIEVVVGELTGMQQLLVEEPPATFAWPQIEGVVRNASLGLASLVVLVLGLMIVRRMKPIALPQSTTTGLSDATSLKLAELSQEARVHPEDVASVISEWLSEEEAAAAQTTKARRRLTNRRSMNPPFHEREDVNKTTMPTDAHEKVAILLKMLGGETAEQVLAKLRPDSAGEIRETLKHLEGRTSTRRQKEQAVVEFDRFYRFARKVGDRRLRIASGTADEEGDSSEPRPWLPFDPGDEPLEDLKKLTPQQLSTCLSEEHPRTAALILRNLPGDASADVLELMPDEHRQQVFVELSSETPLDSDLVERIASAVVRRAITLAPETIPEPDPIQMAADVLRSVNRPQRRPLLEALESSNQEMATELLERLYVFEDILDLDSRNLQRLLGEVDSQTLATALCGAAPELVEKVMSNLAKRARAALSEEMEFQQNTSPGIAEQARKSIASILAQLDQDEV